MMQRFSIKVSESAFLVSMQPWNKFKREFAAKVALTRYAISTFSAIWHKNWDYSVPYSYLTDILPNTLDNPAVSQKYESLIVKLTCV